MLRKLVVALAALVALTVAVYTGLWLFKPKALYDPLASLARMAGGYERSEIDIPGFHIVYLEGGPKDAPPLLLLHGYGADKDHWTRIGALTRKFRVYAPDLPGFGESSRPADAGYRIEDQIPRIEAFAKAVGITQFDLGGNSMGGWLAGAYAIAHPDQVRSLWLLAPAGVASAKPSELAERLAAGEPMPLVVRSAEQFDAVVELASTVRPFIPAPIRAVLVERAIANAPLMEKIYADLLRSAPLDAQLAALPAPLATPTLIVWGEQDRLLNVDGADKLRALLPAATVQRLQGIGHLPMLEAPSDSVRDYMAFRERIRTQQAQTGAKLAQP